MKNKIKCLECGEDFDSRESEWKICQDCFIKMYEKINSKEVRKNLRGIYPKVYTSNDEDVLDDIEFEFELKEAEDE